MFIYIIIRLIQGFLYLMPNKICLLTGRFLGVLGYLIVGSKKKVVISNLKNTIVGKDLSEEEINKLTKKIFINFGITMIEILVSSKYKKKWKSFISVDKLFVEKYNETLKDGAIFLLAHFNNWEILAVEAKGLGLKISTVGQRIKNKYIDSWIIKSRNDLDLELLPKKGFIEKSLQVLEDKRVVAFLADQNGGRHGEQMNFLGKSASTFITPAILAIKSKKPIIPVFDIRNNKTGKHEVVFGEPIFAEKFLKNNNIKETNLLITQECVRILEDKIKQYPEAWFWMHKRWKR
jgi:Kdo2-lipid IVA lauroyltransferase/acyltransferase